MLLSAASNPVNKSYDNEDTFNLHKLDDFWRVSNSNFQLIQAEFMTLKLDLNSARHTNKQLTQLLNWIAVTNPQILDEFQTTAHAFDKLVPRNTGDGPVAVTTV